MKTSKNKAQELLHIADITIDGPNPWDIQVKDDRVYERVFAGGPLALGESYMDGWWEVSSLDQFIDRVLRAQLPKHVGADLETWWYVTKSSLFNLQSKARASQVAEFHYDLGNDLYEHMLGPEMVYTCGYWSGSPKARTLSEAQIAKMDLVCRKVGLKRGDRVLDIGCGFGSFAKHAAETYGAEVVGISVSKEQIEYAKEFTKGLPVEIRYQDYRDLNEKFDHIISIGMFEAVGYKNFRTFMRKVADSLKDEGLFLLHTIGGNRTSKTSDPWFDKYIFRNGMLPSIKSMGESIEGLFVMEDWHNFGADYDHTLMQWFKNFDDAWPHLKEKYGDRFYRMWKYYLLSMAGAFRSRQNNQLWQIVLSKYGVHGGHKTVR